MFQSIKFQCKEEEKVYKVCPAFDDSFVIQTSNMIDFAKLQKKIIHLSKNGELLGQISNKNIWSEFKMINMYEVIFIADEKKQINISILDLKEHKIIKEVQFPKDSEQDQASFETFKESNKILITLKNRTKKTLRLKYYNSDLLEEGEEKDSKIEYSGLPIFKIDEFSGVAWPEKEDYGTTSPFSFAELSLSKKGEVQVNRITTQNTFNHIFNHLEDKIGILNIKKVDDNSYFVFTNAFIKSNVTVFEVEILFPGTEGEIIKMKTVDEVFQGKKHKRVLSFCKFFIFEESSKDNNQLFGHFIDYETKTNPISNHKNMIMSYFEVGWNERMVACLEETFDKPGLCIINKYVIFEQKDMFLHMLLGQDQDFDDDLLLDALTLLDVVTK